MEDRQYHEAHTGLASPAPEQYNAAMGANSHMVGGSHYKLPDATGQCPHCRRQIEHWDWSFNLRGLEYAATKYIARWRDKGDPLDNLKKAIHYVQKIIEIHFPGVVVHVDFGDSAPTGTGICHEPSTTLGLSGAARKYDAGASGEEAPRSFAVDGSEFKNKALRDACSSCFGKRGGVPGNENIVNGVVLCDYCSADLMLKKVGQTNRETKRV